ncbi:MAG: ATP/GTP-binding protein, partial [Candidatus Bathyarchaeia archaeon]
NPMNYVSNLFLSAAVYSRFFTPQINVLSKSDLVPQEKLNQIVDWSRSPLKIEEAIENELGGDMRLLSRDLMHVIYRLGLRFLLIPVSAKTYDGMVNVNTAIERALAGGDKYTVE